MVDFDQITTLLLGVLGGGAGGGILGWRLQRRKQTAEVKSDEIENMRKAMEEFYDPLVKKQNERIAQQDKRIAELEAEIKTSRDERAKMEKSYQEQIASLQKQITEITRALGIKANRQLRNERGQFTKTWEEAGEE